MANVQFSVTTQLIGKDLKAYVQSLDNGNYYVILPTDSGDDTPITIASAIAQINNFIQGLTGSAGTISETDIMAAGNSLWQDFSNCQVMLKQAYLYVFAPADTNQQKNVEYAFEVFIRMPNGSAEGKLFALKEISFTVWDCPSGKRKDLLMKAMSVIDLSNPATAVESALQKSIDDMSKNTAVNPV